MGKLPLIILLAAIAAPCSVKAQDDGGVTYDASGQELLQSIQVPPLSHAPFSLQLATEWSRPMNNGGTYTIANSRPIKRDSAGRIYEERWLLEPKGTKIASRISWIQIADPLAKTLLECNARQHICELEDWRGWNQTPGKPELAVSAPLKSGRGTYLHEDLGPQYFAGLPTHAFRDTTKLNPGTMGNDLPLLTIREFRFSPELGINLTSVLDTPQLGKQIFTVTEITTTEPDPKWFQTPEGYKVVDHRKNAATTP